MQSVSKRQTELKWAGGYGNYENTMKIDFMTEKSVILTVV